MRIDNIGHRITIPLVLNGEEITALIDTGSSETYLNLRTAGRLFDLTSESPGMQQTSSRTDRNGVTRTNIASSLNRSRWATLLSIIPG